VETNKHGPAMLWELHLHFYFSVEEYHVPFGSKTLALVYLFGCFCLYCIL